MSLLAAVGMSHHHNPQIAGREAIEQALMRGAIEKPDFVFLFATVGYDQPTIVKTVREASGGAPLCGCSGEGIITEQQTDESNFAVAVMAISSDEMQFRHGIVTGLKMDPTGAGCAIGVAIRPALRTDTRALFLFPDGLTVNFDRLLAGLEGQLHLDHLLPIVGGTSGDNWQLKHTYQYCDDEVVTDGVAWALLSGQVQVAWAVNHGCLPIGLEHKVTRAQGNVIYEIDHKPVLELLKDYLTDDEIADWGKAVVNVTLGFKAPAEMSDYDQYLIRYMPTKDDQVGAVTIPTEVAPGTSIWMTRRDYEKVAAGVDRLATQLLAQLGDRPARLVLQFECAGRGKIFLRDQLRLQLLRRLQRQLPNVPWLGIYTLGEIGPVGSRNCFHNYTAVVAAIF
jgi:hypothetical protein